MTCSRYKGCLNQTDPRTCITEIQKAPYATDPNYIKTIMSIVDILVNVFICRFPFHNSNTSVRYTFWPANIFVVEYKYNLVRYDGVVTGNSVHGNRPTVRKGSRGEHVVYLQTRLVAQGYSVGKIDGIFGIKTLEAVKAFQIENGLSVDGIVGAKTWMALQ